MAKKDYSTQGKSHPKPESQGKSSKKKLTEKEIAENARKKLAEISSPYHDPIFQEERDKCIAAEAKNIELAELTNRELIALCATLKADLDISRKQIKAIKEIVVLTAEIGVAVETNKQEIINRLLLEKMKKKG